MKEPRAPAPFALWGLLILGFAARAALALQPVSVLIRKFLSDDAYYYFAIARNLARGMGASFDGAAPTNGFHPLYVLSLAPLYRLAGGNPDLPVHLALLLLSVFDCLAGWLVYRIVRSLSDERGALIGSCFWLLNPCVFFVLFTGTEASLCAFCVALAFLLYLRLLDEGGKEARRALLLGAATGAAMLARSDSLFLLPSFALGLVAARRGEAKRRAADAAFLGAAALLVCAPWLWWNLDRFGTILQVSGQAKALREYLAYLKGGGVSSPGALALKSVESFKAAYVMVATSSGLRTAGFTLLLALALCGAAAGLARGVFRSAAIIPLIAYPLFIIFFYGLYFWHIQAWYFHSAFMAFSILLGLGSTHLVSLLPPRARLVWVPALAAVMAAAWASGIRHWRIGFYPWQQAYYEAALDLGRRFGERERFGAFNSGIYGYYSPSPVVNMDGLVNNAAFAAMKDGTLFTDFLRENRIRYLIDHEYIVKTNWGLFGQGRMEDRLLPVAAVEIPWRFSEGGEARIVVYEVRAAPGACGDRPGIGGR